VNLDTTISIFAYGTSEGVKKEWDTRGRGVKTVSIPKTMPALRNLTSKYIQKYGAKNLQFIGDGSAPSTLIDLYRDAGLQSSFFAWVHESPSLAVIYCKVYSVSRNIPLDLIYYWYHTAGMAKVNISGYRCERCEHEWIPRDKSQEPRVCPKCKSPYWNKPRKASGKKGKK
jgi:hypothetical protein